MDAVTARNGWLEGSGTAVRYAMEVADIIGEEVAGICRMMTDYAESVHATTIRAARSWLEASMRFRDELREEALAVLGAPVEMAERKTPSATEKKS